MPAIHAARLTGLMLDNLTLVACPAPSYEITPVQFLVLLLSLILLASSDVFFGLVGTLAILNVQRLVS